MFNNEIEKERYLQERIDEVMDWFDFEKVHKAMVALNWEWIGVGVPEIPDMRKKVREYMRDTFNRVVAGKNKSFCSCGGFSVTCENQDGVIFFNVSFEVAEWITDAE